LSPTLFTHHYSIIGIEYYDKNVLNQLVEFMHYYTTELLSEAKLYRDYAKKKNIDVNDVRLAIQARSYNSFTRPLPISFMKAIAADKNLQLLPKIEDLQAIKDSSTKLTAILPSNEYCQINPNIHVISEEIQKEVQEKVRRIFNRKQNDH
jgi:transcription initiation factor TFIID subunit 9B